MPIQSPLGSPQINMIVLNTVVDPSTAVPTFNAPGSSSTSFSTITGVNFVYFSGRPGFHVVWGHAATSTAGNQIIQLYDHTNGVVLASASSNVSTATNTVSTAIATTITYIKPSGVAEVGLRIVNNDAAARLFSFYSAFITL